MQRLRNRTVGLFPPVSVSDKLTGIKLLRRSLPNPSLARAQGHLRGYWTRVVRSFRSLKSRIGRMIWLYLSYRPYLLELSLARNNPDHPKFVDFAISV